MALNEAVIVHAGHAISESVDNFLLSDRAFSEDAASAYTMEVLSRLAWQAIISNKGIFGEMVGLLKRSN